MLYLPLILAILLQHSHSGNAANTISSVPHLSQSSTCPYRTINYITHGLAQQCLPSSRNGEKGAVNTTTTNVVATAPLSARSLISSTSIVPLENSDSSRKTDNGTQPEVIKTSLIASRETASIAIPSATTQSTLPEVTDEDTELESEKFLSFEDWKKQNLIKAGQSEHLGKDTKAESREPRKRPSSVHNSLDSLGDDIEIDLDFSGFLPGGPERPSSGESNVNESQSVSGEAIDLDAKPKAGSASKDAGTTSKERYNYASFDCAANVLKTNPKAQSPGSVLGENKDAYMLNECSIQNKFMIIELCDDISIDTIVLANFEFFSSIFRTFRVSLSDKYPITTDKWKYLGTFEARNTREIQAFLVENPVIWARYIRFEFLTHYGHEFYCPLSLIRVHGTTMYEEYKHDMDVSMGEEEDESEPFELPSDQTANAIVSETAATSVLTNTPITTKTAEAGTHTSGTLSKVERTQMQPKVLEQTASLGEPNLKARPFPDLSTLQVIMPATQDAETCTVQKSGEDHTTVWSEETSSSKTQKLPANLVQTSSQGKVSSSAAVQSTESKNTLSSFNETNSNPLNSSTHNATLSSVSAKSATNTTESNQVSTTSADKIKVASSASTRTKSTASGAQANQPVPTMQESFFKSVQKRLQMMEANSSLSLQYIEDQSRALRDAFKKTEQRQLAKTTNFLDQLNATVLTELREFRQQYDQLWQSTVIELELQRERYERDNEAINARLGILANEVIFQKRMGILQMLLILVCLVLVLFSRGAIHNYLELPIVQSVLSKSPSSRWMNLSTNDTPSSSPEISRVRSAQQLRNRGGILKQHRRMRSQESLADTLSPSDAYSPPTPVSYDGQSDVEQLDNDCGMEEQGSGRETSVYGDIDFDPNEIERPSTSPPVLPDGDGLVTPRFSRLTDERSIDSRLLGHTSSPQLGNDLPKLVIEEASPLPKHLSWNIPE